MLHLFLASLGNSFFGIQEVLAKNSQTEQSWASTASVSVKFFIYDLLAAHLLRGFLIFHDFRIPVTVIGV